MGRNGSNSRQSASAGLDTSVRIAIVRAGLKCTMLLRYPVAEGVSTLRTFAYCVGVVTLASIVHPIPFEPNGSGC